jgi:DNA-binding transcriptional ArsR family regulator
VWALSGDAHTTSVKTRARLPVWRGAPLDTVMLRVVAHSMHRKSVLLAVPCDVKKLPIGGLEAFVLSHVGERSLVEDVAETAGLEVEEMLRLAQRLLDLGALVLEEDGGKGRRRSSGSHRAAPKNTTTPPRSSRSSGSHKAAKASAPPKTKISSGSLRVAKNTAPPGSRRSSASLRAAKVTHPPSSSLVPVASVPLQRKRADLRTLQLGPREGFVLSQIDGATSVGDLAEITRLTLPELDQALRALEAAGAVEVPNRRKRTPASSPAIRIEPLPTSITLKVRAPALPLNDTERVLIMDAATRVDVPSHYEVLGVPRDADTKTIRRAYHALAAQFHPDRFFGKDLGTCRQPLERVFDRITKAYDVLSHRTEREAHDETLGPAPPSPRVSSVPGRKSSRKMKAAKSVAHVEAARPVAAPAAKAESLPAGLIPSVPRARPSTPAPEAVVAASPPPAPVVPTSAVPVRSPSVLPGPGATSAHMRARANPLFRMFAANKPQKTGRGEHVAVFVRAAQDALARDDLVGAANNYRLAVQVTDDPTVHAAFNEVEAKARARVHETSLAQAKTAEAAGRWTEAGAKYARAYEIRPQPWVAERAANALRLDGKELKKAAHLAEQAVLAEPQNALYRVTLGEIYWDAGLMNRAVGESGRASALAPSDARVLALASRVANVKKS